VFFVPSPTATTVPFWFFFSGIRNKIPDAVFVSAATGSIRTRSESGLMFKAMIFLIILVRSQSQKLCQPYYTDIFLIKMPALTGWHFLFYCYVLFCNWVLLYWCNGATGAAVSVLSMILEPYRLMFP
jgi:hypothetical protein